MSHFITLSLILSRRPIIFHHQASINEFSDIEYAKFAAKILVNPTPDPAKRFRENPQGARRHLASAVPAAKVNWTALGKVTPVKKQGKGLGFRILGLKP